MPYGSSSIANIKLLQVAGQTGEPGPRGFPGPRGETGDPGISGITGPSILYMSALNIDKKISTAFDDGVFTTTLSPVRGSTGNWYLFADADVISSAFRIVYGTSYFYQPVGPCGPVGFDRNVLMFRGLTTNDPQILKLTRSGGNLDSHIILNYDLFNITSLELTPPYISRSVVYSQPGASGEEIKGLANTLFLPSYESEYERSGLIGGTFVNLSANYFMGQVKNYSERVQFVNANSIQIGTDATRRIYYWSIDYEKGNIVKLNPYNSSGQTVVAQVVYIKSPTNELMSEGLTIIIPSGVTSSNNFTTLFATTDDINIPPNQNLELLEQNISWPLSVPPCITTKVDILNLISFGNIWYADFSHHGITFKESQIDFIGDVDKIPTKVQITEDLYQCASGSNAFGYCCPRECGVTGFETIEVLCDGTFYLGMTGSTCDNVCSRTGVCCLFTQQQQVIKLQDFVAACECSSFAEKNGYQYIWTQKDNNILNVNDIDCVNANLGIGGCCDGKGTCTQLSFDECKSSGGFYHGDGVKCEFTNATLLCNGGTGGCCFPSTNTCTQNTPFDQCMTSNGIYFGRNTICSDFTCTSTCLNGVYGIPPLTVGSEFEGGIVVGVFSTQKTLCFGNKKFGGIPLNYVAGISDEQILGSTFIFNYLTNGDEKPAELYFTRSDRMGYGFTQDVEHECEKDSWILIVGKYPIILNEISDPTRIVSENVNDTTTVKTFTWSHGGTYFGFPIDDALKTPTNNEDENAICPESIEFPGLAEPILYVRDEGWYAFFDQGASGSTETISYYGNRETFKACSDYFTSCPLKRASLVPLYARCGSEKAWRRNWGMYNTIAMVGAELWANKTIQIEGAPDNSNFNFNIGQGFTSVYSIWSTSQQSSGEAISAYNIGKSQNAYYPKLSKWFIPSVDELSFIAHKIANDDLNGKILAAGGVPVGDVSLGADGWVWTSTGTFDEGITAEYIQKQGIGYPATLNEAPLYNVLHGSEAWAMKFDSTNLSNIRIGKKHRINNKYEVRPVRMIRCDGKYYDINSSNSSINNPAKYWSFWSMSDLPITNVINGPDL